MNEKDFTARVRQLVADYTNEHLDATDKKTHPTQWRVHRVAVQGTSELQGSGQHGPV